MNKLETLCWQYISYKLMGTITHNLSSVKRSGRIHPEKFERDLYEVNRPASMKSALAWLNSKGAKSLHSIDFSFKIGIDESFYTPEIQSTNVKSGIGTAYFWLLVNVFPKIASANQNRIGLFNCAVSESSVKFSFKEGTLLPEELVGATVKYSAFGFPGLVDLEIAVLRSGVTITCADSPITAMQHAASSPSSQ
jgi:hypothetical protein